MGFGSAMIWVAQGNFLTLNSDKTTMEQNSGIFWAIFQCCMVIGNAYYYFAVQGETDIGKETRTTVSFFDREVLVIALLLLLFSMRAKLIFALFEDW